MLIVYHVLMEKQMQDAINLQERVIQLHDIARQVEQEIGNGSLAEDIRKAADKLNELVK